MDCPSESAFEKFVAGQLPAAAEGPIAAHLEACQRCRQRAQSLCGSVPLRTVESAERTLDLHSGDATHAEPADERAELYRLIEGESHGGLPGSEQAADLFRLLSAGPSSHVAGAKLGRFTVGRWLGAGGFGVVFLAYDDLLRREVALKLPRVQSLAHREVRERFLREAEAAAQLHHPNVVPVFEAGEAQGICYIASQYCPGPTLDRWLAEQREPVAVGKAVAIVRQLAEAVQHAHEHRVLHRDIKPSNILLEPHPASPLAMTPKITDFGLAKWLDTDASMTGVREMVGTPRYMSPEQATGDRSAMGPATDVFALGAVLYELLSGVAPFVGHDQTHTLHRLLSERVVPLRRSRSDLPRDLEAICLKCLEKKGGDRYGTAQQLVDDLRRFELGHTTFARPLGRLEMLRRWSLRQPAIAALLAVIAVGLLSLLGIFVAYNRSLESFNDEMQMALEETRRAQSVGEEHLGRLRNLLYVSKVERAHQAIQENDLPQASRLLRELDSEAPGVARNFIWRYLWNRIATQGHQIHGADADIYDLQVSPSGKLLAVCGADSVLRTYEGQSFAPRLKVATQQGEINAVAFSPDERWIATAGDDGTVRLWDAATGSPHRNIAAHDALAFGVVFTPDGETLISCGNEPVIRLWNSKTGKPQGTLQGHSRAVEAIAISPAGTHLASACSDTTARIWELLSRSTQHVLQGHQNRMVDVQYSDSGDFLLTGSIDRTIRLWRTADGRCLQIESHVDPITSVAFLGGDAMLAAADRGGSIHTWQRKSEESDELATSAAPLHSWKAHSGRAWDITALPGRVELLSAGADGRVYRWERPPPAQQSLEVERDHEIYDAVFGADSATVHLIHSHSGVQTWDIASGRRTTLVERSVAGDRQPWRLAMLPAGVLIMGFSDGASEGIELAPPHQRSKLSPAWKADMSGRIDDLAVSHNGQRLAVFSFARDATLVYDVAEQRLIGTFKAYSQAMALSADGRHLAMSDGDDVVVWDIDAYRLTDRLQGHTSSIRSLDFSPDGRYLASGSKDRHVRIWDLQHQNDSTVLAGHRGDVEAVCFSPDGRLLASGDSRGELTFWFLQEASKLISINAGEQPIQKLRFSPAGDRLAIRTTKRIQIFSAAPAGFDDSRAALGER